MATVLSVHDGHNASAAILKDGKVLSCVSEERINREKFYWGWPHLSIDYVLADCGLKLTDVDVVSTSHQSALSYAKRKLTSPDIYNLSKPKMALGHAYNIFTSMKRDAALRSLAWKAGAKLFFCDHHLAHAASAYYFAGYEDALVITADALGDSLSHTAYEVKNGVWKKLVDGNSRESLGEFYAAVTEGLGFRPNRHEGKVVGLAAFSDPAKLQARCQGLFVEISEDRLHFTRKGYKDMVASTKTLLSEGFSKEDISAYAQNLLEELMVKHVSALMKLTPVKNVAAAGGVFANVKMNQRIFERCGVEHLFIQPAMGDEGLVLGSAAHYVSQHGGFTNEPMHDVFFGTHYSVDEVREHLKTTKYTVRDLENPATEVADLVAAGNIVGWFEGRMEFGPRALGHRSIIADPRNKQVNDILNKRLKRSEFMPFAPSVLEEFADTLFEFVEPARHTAAFMTVTFDVKAEWKQKIPAITHVDGTARPQLVSKEVSPAYHAVISAFEKTTGIPLVMNTSFNIHEEPIVSSPEDALRSLEQGAVDYVVFENKILVSK